MGAGCTQEKTIGAGWLAPAELDEHRCDRVLGSRSGERERGGNHPAAKLPSCQAVKWAPVFHMGQRGRRHQDPLKGSALVTCLMLDITNMLIMPIMPLTPCCLMLHSIYVGSPNNTMRNDNVAVRSGWLAIFLPPFL